MRCAFAAELPPGPIVIGRDGRATGPMLAAALTAGLTAVGRDVIDAGVAATPTSGVLVRARARGRRHSDFGQPQSAAVQRAQTVFRRGTRDSRRRRAEGARALPQSDATDWVPHDRVAHVRNCDDTTVAASGH